MKKDYFVKKQEKEDKDAFIRKYLLAKLADIGITGKADTYGNIKFESKDRQYRYHIKNRIVRKEVLSIHEATQYSPASKSWTCVKTLSYNDLITVGTKYFNSKE